MASQSDMLMALHKANPKTLGMRYTAQQLAAAYAALPQKGTNPAAGTGVANAGTVTGTQNAIATDAGNVADKQVKSGVYDTPFTFNADEAARQRVEDATYAKLTRNVDQQQGLDTEQAQQNLVNRGIPYSADPNSQYQQQLHDVTNRYDTIRENARGDATTAGQAELQNQYNIQSGTYNTALGGTQTLSNLGVPGSVSFENLSEQDKQRLTQIAIEKLRLKNQGGGGGTQDAFAGSGPPGL